MQKSSLFAAVSATVAFGCAATSQAATITIDLTFTGTIFDPAGPTTGSGFLKIDDTYLNATTIPVGGPFPFPILFRDTSDPAAIQDLSVTFAGIPGFDPLSFNEDDVTQLTLKILGDTVQSVNFSTDMSSTHPYLSLVPGSPLIDLFGPDGTQIGQYTITPTVSAVPLPGGLGLLASGLAALPLLRARRAKRAQPDGAQ